MVLTKLLADGAKLTPVSKLLNFPCPVSAARTMKDTTR
nr:MAG TPA: hypothetical protein [Caudoviricetes sp.]DAM77579.1 MAG TPA: hypothetical protein [Caudoviricetes sp.]